MPITDYFSGSFPNLNSPASGVIEITPDDGTDLEVMSRAIMVSTLGDVAVVMKDGTTGVLPSLQPGVPYPVRVSRVLAAGTTATGIVGLY